MRELTHPLIRCTSLYRLVRDRYSTFLLLGVSSPWLLLAVSVTRHWCNWPLHNVSYTRQSTYPVKGITCIFTQTFYYPTFQLLDVSALPFQMASFVWQKHWSLFSKKLKQRDRDFTGACNRSLLSGVWLLFVSCCRFCGRSTENCFTG